MAKRRVNKSAKVREYLLGHPDHPPRRVAQALKPLKVTAQYVSSIKLQMKKEGMFPGSAPARAVASAMAEESGDTVAVSPGETADIEALVAAVRLLRRCATLKEAHRTLDQAERLARALGHG